MSDLVPALEASFQLLRGLIGAHEPADIMGHPLPPPSSLIAPVFYSDDIVHIRKMPDQRVDQVPFAAFWLVYRTNNGVLGHIDNAVYVSEGRAKCFGHLSIHADEFTWVGQPADFPLDADRSNLTSSGADYLPEVTGCILSLDRPDGQPGDKRLRGQSEKRAERLRRIHNIPKFIHVAHRETEEHEPLGGGGWSQSPHNRRGHWRTYRQTGKRVWVRDCAIHGGSDVGRDYLMKV